MQPKVLRLWGAAERTSLGKRTLDATQAGRVYDAVAAAWSSTAEAARFYRTNLVGRSGSDRLPAESLSTGSELTVVARRRIAAATGTLAGIQFNDQQLSTYTEGLRTDFQAADVTLAMFERFFKSYASGDVKDAISLLRAADADILGAKREAATTMTRARSWSERVDALMNELIADSNALNAKQRSFSLELYVTIPASLYGASFLVVAFSVWFRTRARRDKRYSARAEVTMSKEPQLMEVFLDLLPNQPKTDQTRENFRDLLRQKLEGRLPDAVERIWELPPVMLKPQGEYLALLLEARELYIAGHFYSCVAMCGIVGERLVKDVLRAYILVRKGNSAQPPPEVAFDQLERIDVNGIIRFLKEADLLSVEAAKAADSLGQLRNQYAHARGKDPQPDALKSIKLLHTLVEGTVSILKDFDIKDGVFVPNVSVPKDER